MPMLGMASIDGLERRPDAAHPDTGLAQLRRPASPSRSISCGERPERLHHQRAVEALVRDARHLADALLHHAEPGSRPALV